MTEREQVQPVASWCPPGRSARVAGVDVMAGAFWLGPGVEPSAVDPWLPVDLHFPDWGGHTVTVLRYDRLSPSARGAYLMWLASGRRAPQAPGRWAELYLLGLERRIVHDADDDPALLSEVRAVASTYGGANPTVATLGARLDRLPAYRTPPPLTQGASVMPADLMIEVGRRALADTPVPSDWALAWAWYHPRIALHESARQATDEFARLWQHRFDERYPQGLRVAPRRRRLALGYEPTNPTLPRPIERTIGDASDVFDHPALEQALRDVTDSVERELAPFARWSARNVDGPTVETTAALLPDPLLAGSVAGAAVEPLVDWATERLVEHEIVTIAGHELIGRWTGAGDRAGILAMIQVLERHGIGVEPDVRFGGRPVSDDAGTVVLFATDEDPPSTPSPAYVLAAVMSELCLAVVSADGSIDDGETALLVDRIDRIDDLTPADRRRLAAHRTLVGARPVDLDEVATRAGALPEDARRDLAATVVDIALADGGISDDEQRVVDAVHGLLGVEFDDVDLVSDPALPDTEAPADPAVGPVDDTSSGDEPVPAPTAPSSDDSGTPPESGSSSGPSTAAGPVERGAVIPMPRAVALDERRLARTQASNADVRALLGAIFADDDDDDHGDGEIPVAAAEIQPGGQRIGLLDVRHSRLLSELADAGCWSRPELERACARLAVLPDGALDVVNEASYDVVGDPVIELMDDGSVAVDADVLEEMRA